MTVTQHRSPREVLEDHLRESRTGSIDDDLPRNYAEDVVVLTGRGVYRGHDGMRYLNDLLRKDLPGGTFDYHTVLVDGEVGFLEWTGTSARSRIHDGADSYVIRDGRIVAQTIHYTVVEASRQDETGL